MNKAMTEKEYQDYLDSFQNNSTDPEWMRQFIKHNQKHGLTVTDTRAWIMVDNLKFVNGFSDPKYNYKIRRHYTWFIKESDVENINQLSNGASVELLDLMTKAIKNNFYIYFNSGLTRSIKRLHWHQIQWEQKNGAPVIRDDLQEYLEQVFGKKNL